MVDFSRFAKMLRLLKRYDLGYHMSPSEDSELVPGRSIVMTSYPGALSSQDEYYAVNGVGRELLVAGTHLTTEDQVVRNHANSIDQVSLRMEERIERPIIEIANHRAITPSSIPLSIGDHLRCT